MSALSKIYLFVLMIVLVPILFIFGLFFDGLNPTDITAPSGLVNLTGIDNPAKVLATISFILSICCLVAAVVVIYSLVKQRNNSDYDLGLKITDAPGQ